MAYERALINKETLNYICIKEGITIDYLVQKLKFSNEKIERWLDTSDNLLPTVNQARDLASCLHIPFAALYMNAKDISIRNIPHYKNMRTMFNKTCFDDSAINLAIIDVMTAYDFFVETYEELGLGVSNLSYTALLNVNSNEPQNWASEIRKYLNLSIDEQFKSNSSRKFYLYLRNKVESKGIFIHCFSGVPVEVARGFALYNGRKPIIGLNTDDRYPAKSFSIIHELVHIIKRESSLCNDNFSSFATMKEEIFCNAVAGELLVPYSALSELLLKKNIEAPYESNDIEYVANVFSVSKEVIIRRLLDTNKINKLDYEFYNNLFKAERENSREQYKLDRENGRTIFYKNMSQDAVDRNSPSLCRALYIGYASELYSRNDLSNYLGIKLDSVDRFMKEIATWNN